MLRGDHLWQFHCSLLCAKTKMSDIVLLLVFFLVKIKDIGISNIP